ncbi:MAG TPA: tripartite tricarboxylate transporter substrate-binding protein [Xanthobacteraceae bacterium]|nr:tripartite tricarboxylate transporter substrate-binding protein [Xanthobacteraceae bacterium]
MIRVRSAARGLASLAIAALAATGQPARANDVFPTRPIKIVVPVAPGGAPDVVARLVADKLGPKLGQPVIVEDRPGGGERIGAEFVAKAEPDGYTLLAAPPASLVISPLLFSHLGYDPGAFVPVTVLTSGHLVLVTSPTLNIASLADLVARAKATPGKLTYASPGLGTPPHLTGEMLKAAAKIETTHVPYKGLAPALADLLAGRVDVMFDNLGNSIAYIREGRLKALGIADDARIPELPGVPPIAATFPTVHSTSWFGVVAPPRTPSAIANRLSTAIAQVLHMPDVVEKLHAMSFTPVGSSPGQMTKFMAEETARWRVVVTTVGIKPE